MTPKVRQATASEIEWINSKYQEVNFKPSTFENELIVIAELDNKKCGLGRLVIIDDNNLELGGIYVFENYRKLGVADHIVSFLCDKNDFKQKTIWCLPFEHLQTFYRKFGFKTIEKVTKPIPKEISEKHRWCNANYDAPVLLLCKVN